MRKHSCSTISADSQNNYHPERESTKNITDLDDEK